MEPIERCVTLPTDPDRAWALVSDPAELTQWLGADVDLEVVPGAVGQVVDHDGTLRHVVVADVEGGRRIAWHWWTDDDPASVSRVEIALEPVVDGTAVRVTETLPAAPAPQARVKAGDAWSHRLLHLESLLLVAAAVRG